MAGDPQLGHWIAEMVSMRALECLVTIVEQGSLTKAAAALHMSQPALSHQIAAAGHNRARDEGWVRSSKRAG